MSYTPPASSAVNFQFPDRTYVPTTGDAVELNFGALIDPRISGDGTVVLNGSADVRHGVLMSGCSAVPLVGSSSFLTDAPGVVSGALRVAGGALLYRGAVFSAYGPAIVYGAATILAAQNMTSRGSARLAGGAVLTRGTRLAISYRMSLGGAAEINVGRTLRTYGGILPLLGGVSARHGVALSVGGRIGVDGQAGLSHAQSHSLTLEGPVIASGRMEFTALREASLPSISVMTTVEQLVVFSNGLQ